MNTPLTTTTTDAVMESATVDTLTSDAMETEAPVEVTTTTTTTASDEAEDHALRHTKPRFDYAIGKRHVVVPCGTPCGVSDLLIEPEPTPHALLYTKYLGKDVQDHHFSKTAKPLTAEEATRIKEMGFNNPVGTTHHTEGFIR